MPSFPEFKLLQIYYSNNLWLLILQINNAQYHSFLISLSNFYFLAFSYYSVARWDKRDSRKEGRGELI